MVLTRWDPLFETRKVRRLPNLSWAGFPPFFSVNESSAGNTETRDWSIPLDIVRDGDSVIVAHVIYDHSPLFDGSGFGALTLEDKAYLKPRRTTKVTGP